MSEELTLEKLKISERLATLEANQKINIGMITDIHRAVIGNNGSAGLIVDVDRLKQKDKSRELHGVAIYTTLVGLVIKAIWGFFTGK